MHNHSIPRSADEEAQFLSRCQIGEKYRRINLRLKRRKDFHDPALASRSVARAVNRLCRLTEAGAAGGSS